MSTSAIPTVSARTRESQVSKIRAEKADSALKDIKACVFSHTHPKLTKNAEPAIYGRITRKDGSAGYIRVSKKGEVVRANVGAEIPSYSQVDPVKLFERHNSDLRDYLIGRLNGVTAIDFAENVAQNGNLKKGYYNQLAAMKSSSEYGRTEVERLIAASTDEDGLLDQFLFRESVASSVNELRFKASAVATHRTEYFKKLKEADKAARDVAKATEKEAKAQAKAAEQKATDVQAAIAAEVANFITEESDNNTATADPVTDSVSVNEGQDEVVESITEPVTAEPSADQPAEEPATPED